MANKIVWDAPTERVYENGVDHAVLYPVDPALGTYPKGYAWNGITTITESPSGAEATPLYADNTVYLNTISLEKYGGTIEAYYYPEEFSLCDGTKSPVEGLHVGQQARAPFGLAFRTKMGNDAQGDGYGYKLVLVYGALVAPSEKTHSTVNDSPEVVTFSWTFSTTPVPLTGYNNTSVLTIDSTKIDSLKLAALEAILYGAIPATEGRLPLPAEVVTLLT